MSEKWLADGVDGMNGHSGEVVRAMDRMNGHSDTVAETADRKNERSDGIARDKRQIFNN